MPFLFSDACMTYLLGGNCLLREAACFTGSKDVTSACEVSDVRDDRDSSSDMSEIAVTVAADELLL